MSKIAIVTDSNSGITQKEGKELGISVIPMPFYINEELYFEDITLTQDEFYQKLNEDEDIKTSQPVFKIRYTAGRILVSEIKETSIDTNDAFSSISSSVI